MIQEIDGEVGYLTEDQIDFLINRLNFKRDHKYLVITTPNKFEILTLTKNSEEGVIVMEK